MINLSFARFGSLELPPTRRVELPGGGTTVAYEMAGPPGAPTLFLVHGLVASSYLNWFPAFRALNERFRIVATDLRGHGRGMAVRRFRLEDCADDMAAVAEALEVERCIPVGYSLGGPVAQLFWRRHRDLVEGLVLCATSRNFGGTARERSFFFTLPALVGLIRLVRRGEPMERPEVELGDDALVSRWAMEELRRTDPTVALQAMNAIGRFTSHHWIGEVDVPTAVVVTTRDHFVAPNRQLKLARAIPEATIHPVAAGHAACGLAPRRFVPALVEACESVADRVRERRDATTAKLGAEPEGA